MANDLPHQQRIVISPLMKVGYVSLNVSDLQRSLDFYQQVLGFKIAGNATDGRVFLSAEDGERLVEIQQKDSALSRRAGLYHFAVLLPERKHLANMLHHLSDIGDSVHFDGLADHLVSESIYIRDPDSNGIEIYRDRPKSEWNWNGGRVEMATIGLDTQDLLKDATSPRWKSMPSKTTIGHIHLHVRDLAEAMKFYRDVLGLDFTASYPSAYFFSAGGYHHHIATNTWLGTAIPAASPDTVGLNHFGIELPDQKELQRTLMHISSENLSDGFILDPDGIRIKMYSKDRSLRE
jgi:catechol 2,3-dioxygenase